MTHVHPDMIPALVAAAVLVLFGLIGGAILGVFDR